MDFDYCLSAKCVCFGAAVISEFTNVYHGLVRFAGTLQELIGACFLGMSLKLASSISKEEHTVGDINWHRSVLKVFKSMSRKLLVYLRSAWLTGLIAEESQTTVMIRQNQLANSNRAYNVISWSKHNNMQNIT